MCTAAAVKSFKKLPGPRDIPLFGTVWQYSAILRGRYTFERMNVAKRDNYAKYGKIYREKIGPFTLVQLFDPVDFAKVFRSEGRCPNRPAIPITVVANKRDGISLGLGSLNGEEWRSYRMAVQKLLMHPKAASIYLPNENNVADDFVRLLGNSRNENNNVDDIHEKLLKYATEYNGVICFNKRIGCLADQIPADSDANLMANATRDVFESVQKTAFAFPLFYFVRTPMYKQYVRSYTECNRISTKYIENAWKEVESDPSLIQDSSIQHNPNLLHSLIATGKLSVEQINVILLDLFRAGIDSVAGSMAFFLYNLARHPEEQNKLYTEIQTVTRGRIDVVITDENIANMPFLKACLKESFRLNFPIEGGTTRILETDLVLSGYSIPKGTIVAMNNQTILQDDAYFDEPLLFKPERWLKNTINKTVPKFTMLPFGYGMRMCVGRRFAELAIYLATLKILKKYRIEYDRGNVDMLNRVFTIPDKPISIKFIDRQH
ncbi:cytochrome P450 10-like [Tubulanus polymorphus]|uniref:cytochrome P450 10-like n=1 Tax=Tubulanus polymorphus TaxID=672921 RepID=UPI003DA52963